MFKYVELLALAAVGIGLASCTSETVTSSKLVSSDETIDGSEHSYYYPKATWTFTAQYTPHEKPASGQPDQFPIPIVISGPASPALVANYKEGLHWLTYRHAGLSDDDMDVQIDPATGFLVEIGSKSSDQTNTALSSADDFLTAIGKLAPAATSSATSGSAKAKSASAAIASTGGSKPSDPWDFGLLCPNIVKSDLVLSEVKPTPTFKYSPQAQVAVIHGGNCEIHMRAVVSKAGDGPLQIGGSQRLTADDMAFVTDRCAADAVCFPLAQPVTVTVTASLVECSSLPQDSSTGEPATQGKAQTDAQPAKTDAAASPANETIAIKEDQEPCKTPPGADLFDAKATFSGNVPSYEQWGFIQFSRRSFVANATDAKFQNGLISEFHSTDPSDLVNTFALAIALSK